MTGDYLPPTVARLLADDAEFNATVDRAIRKTDSLKREIDRLGRTRSTPQIVLEDVEAKLRLSRFEDRLQRVSEKVATARVDVTGDRAARRQLDLLDLQLRRVGQITARPNVNLQGVARAELQLEALQLRLDALNDRGPALGRLTSGLQGVGSHAPGLLGMGLGLAPAALPLAGVGLGAGAALLNPFAAATIGVGAFAAAAVPDIKKVTGAVAKLAQYQKQYEDATTAKQRAAALHKEKQLWEDLNPAQAAAVKQVQTLGATYGKFQHVLEPQVFKVLGGGAQFASSMLGLLAPVARSTGNELAILEHRATHALTSPFWQNFFSFLAGEAPRAVDALGMSLGHLAGGLAHLVEGFAPLGHDFEHILVRASKSFETWTKGSGPGKFVAWVEKNGPQAAKALGALGHALIGLGKGLMPLGQVELAALTPVLRFIGDMSAQHPEVVKDLGLALITLSIGLKAAQGAAAISGVIGTVDALITKYGLLGRTAGAAALAEEAANTAGGAGGKGSGVAKLAGKGAIGLGGPLTVAGILALVAASAPSQGPLHRDDGALKTADGKPALMGRFGSGGQDYSRAGNLARFNKDLQAVRHSVVSVTVAEKRFSDAMSNAGAIAQRVGSRDIQGNSFAAQANRAAIDNAVTALFGYKQSLLASGMSASEARRRTLEHASALEAQLVKLYGNKKAVDALLRSLHAMPRQINTDINVNVKVQAAQLTKLGRLGAQMDTFGAPPKQHAAGGLPPMDGSVFTVGEHGKEVMRMYHGKLQVLTPSQARRVLGSEIANSMLRPLEAGNRAGYNAAVTAGTSRLAALPGTAKQRAAALHTAEISAFSHALTFLYARERHGERVVSHAREFLDRLPRRLAQIGPRNVAAFARLDRHTEHVVDRLRHQRRIDRELLHTAQVLERVTRGTREHARAVRDLHRATGDLAKVDKTLATARKDEAKVDAALDHARRLRAAVEAPGLHAAPRLGRGGYLAMQAAAHVHQYQVHVHGSVWAERDLFSRMSTLARRQERRGNNNGLTNVRGR